MNCIYVFLLGVVICNDNSVDDMSVLVNLEGSEVKKRKKNVDGKYGRWTLVDGNGTSVWIS